MEKTTTKPSKVSPPRPADAADAAPPRLPSDIPSLGPIRLRALQKAGYSTLSALRAASLETLSAVPGLSEAKARHIRDYLAQFPALPEPAPEPEPKRKKKAAAATESVSGEQASLAQTLPIQKAAAHAMNRVVTLLVSAAEANLRPRLLRELARFAGRAETLIADAHTLSPKDRESAENYLKRAMALLSDAWTHNDLDKKAQARLADDLTDLTDAL